MNIRNIHRMNKVDTQYDGFDNTDSFILTHILKCTKIYTYKTYFQFNEL